MRRFQADGGALDTHYAFEFMRENLDELWQHGLPIVQNPFGARAVRKFRMTSDQAMDEVDVRGIDDRVKVHAGAVATHAHELARLIQYVRDAAGHSRGKVAPGLAQHHHSPFGHVFAAMVAHGFHHGSGAGVPHGKAFPRHAIEESLTAGSAVKDNVTYQDVLFRLEGRISWRVDGKLAAGTTMARNVRKLG